MTKLEEKLVEYIDDAYAMEQNVLRMLDSMIGTTKDPQMKRAYEIALRAAQSGISVLITGETGSGKEIFAETIHQRSNRRHRPFLRLNCAALM